MPNTAPPLSRIVTLPPRIYFTISLGAAFAALAWTAFLLAPGSPLPAFDLHIANFWRDWDRTHPVEWPLMVWLTDMGGVASMTILAGMGSLWQASLHRRRLALAWVLIVFGAGLLNLAVKTTVDRRRPPEADRAVLETNESFPSGHTMGSTIGYGMLAYGLALQQPNRRRRLSMLTTLVVLVLGIGLSRVYLRAHWFSDVIAGGLYGLAWLCGWLGVLERARRATRPASARQGPDQPTLV